MENIKEFIKEYDKVISKLVTAMLWLGIGGIIGYSIGVYQMFDMVIK